MVPPPISVADRIRIGITTLVGGWYALLASKGNLCALESVCSEIGK